MNYSVSNEKISVSGHGQISPLNGHFKRNSCSLLPKLCLFQYSIVDIIPVNGIAIRKRSNWKFMPNFNGNYSVYFSRQTLATEKIG